MRWSLRLKHWIKQWFVKPVCSYCTLSCEPSYDGHCEICDEYNEGKIK